MPLSDADLTNLLGEAAEGITGLTDLFDQMEIAQDEIEKKLADQGRPVLRAPEGHVIGHVAGPIWDAFPLLRPAIDMTTYSDDLYRSHCLELLNRVASGQDTRPATNAELLIVSRKVTLITPVTGAAFGFHMRLFNPVMSQHTATILAEIGRTLDDYEHMYGAQMDDLEREARWKGRQEWRNAPPVADAVEAAAV